MPAGSGQTLSMKKRDDSAPPGTGSDCEFSRGLIDELSTLEAMLDGLDSVDEVENKEFERAHKNDQRE